MLLLYKVHGDSARLVPNGTSFNVNDVLLITRRVLSLYKVHGDSARLVLNGTSFNGSKPLLALI